MPFCPPMERRTQNAGGDSNLSILDSINEPGDLKKLNYEELDELCCEIRQFLIEKVARNGGHLASNLGVVELTVALHRVYDTSKDRLVFDVGHQCYVHKLLTGRKDEFDTLRCLDGLSGFIRPRESIHDAAVSGHASDSVSLALGMATARSLEGAKYSVAALIGDGALTGGLSFEGMANAGVSREPLVVIVNDNGMSISGSVGGMARHLSEMRVEPSYIRFKRWYRKVFERFPRLYNFNHSIKERIKRRILPHNFFDEMGFQYLGPVDGHDIRQLETVLRWAKEMNEPVVVHAITQKGRGYYFAEKNPEVYHGVGRFDAESGVEESGEKSFSGVFGTAMCRLAERDKSLVAITASMCAGTGLNDFSRNYPDRFFDVGIAEGHAVTMAAGMAAQGLHPVFAVYSTFLQRSYDMLIHDVALSGLHVILAVDRAGIVGQDGETHHGLFDVSYLCSVPGMTVLCPSNYRELRDMLETAIYQVKGPVALRFPRGGEGDFTESTADRPAAVVREGKDITIAVYGTMINRALAVGRLLEKQGVSAEIVKLNVISDFDETTVLDSLRKTGVLLAPEEVCSHGCVGQRILSLCGERGIDLRGAKLLNLGEGIVFQGSPDELAERSGLDAKGISAAAQELLSGTRD